MHDHTTLTPAHSDFLEQTFARNRETFGGFSMELEGGDESGSGEGSGEPNAEAGSEQNNTEGTEGSQEEANKETEGKADESNEDEESKALDLDGAKAALSKVRKEAASSRTKLRDLEAQLAAAKTPEQVKEITDKLASDNAAETRALLVENVALQANLPKEAHSRLVGNTREELEADAKALATLLGSSASGNQNDPELRGGLDPNEGDEGDFGVEQAMKAARAARRSRGR